MATSPAQPTRAAVSGGGQGAKKVEIIKRARRRAPRRGRSTRDPLTRLVSQVAFLPLLVALAILHLFYYLYIRLYSAAKRRDLQSRDALTIKFKQIRQARRVREGLLHSFWKQHEAEAEDRLLQVGNAIRTKETASAQTTGIAGVEAADKKRAKASMPLRHFAIAFGPRPMRTRNVLSRAVLKLLTKSAQKALGLEQVHAKADPLKELARRHEETASQLAYMMESTRAAVRYCAMAAVTELTVFDEDGLLQEALRQEPRSLDAEYHFFGFEAAEEGAISFLPSSDLIADRRVRSLQMLGSHDVASPRTPRSRASSLSGGAACTSGSDDETALTDDDSHRTSEEHPQERLDDVLQLAQTKSSPNVCITADVRFPRYADDREYQTGDRNDATSRTSSRDMVLRVNVLSSRDSKAALARAASFLASKTNAHPSISHQTISASDVQHVLEAQFQDYPNEPDVVLIHGGSRHVTTLHGFPPWLVKLCEIAHDVDAQPDATLTPSSFEDAMRRYKGAEQRFGK